MTVKYYGSETEKAIDNFSVSGYKMYPLFIKSFAAVKLACAEVNAELGFLDNDIFLAISRACKEILSGKHFEQFPLDPFQGGAGTSFNMNVNEVIAARAEELIEGKFSIDPLRHVNLHQSTNDVYPTALKVAVLFYLKKLETAVGDMQTTLQHKEQEFKDVVKLGRTQLQDAVPMTLGMTFGAFAEAIARDRWRVFKCRERIKTVNLGGTAIGTGLTAPRDYIFKVTDRLRKITGLAVSRSENLIDSTQNQDQFAEISGILKAAAVNLLKIGTDLRLLSSGPDGGFGEIILPVRQKGSTVMPGKVNPVMPEMISQVAIKIMANDQIISVCAASGNLELNQFMPLISYTVLESLHLMSNTVPLFNEKCLKGIKANNENCMSNLLKSKSLATVMIEKAGYKKVEEILAESISSGKSVKEIVLAINLFSEEEFDDLMNPGKMYKLGY
ncbi:MAG: aspartate ammonia-lyase [Candidatus Cloacimonadota bacterium]|nr:MAG: aspartate ammonia-lyase [Candidatus Cloacimonadota bacterium]